MNHNKIKRSKENLVEGEETGGARAEGCAGQKACYLETYLEGCTPPIQPLGN